MSDKRERCEPFFIQAAGAGMIRSTIKGQTLVDFYRSEHPIDITPVPKAEVSKTQSKVFKTRR